MLHFSVNLLKDNGNLASFRIAEEKLKVGISPEDDFLIHARQVFYTELYSSLKRCPLLKIIPVFFTLGCVDSSKNRVWSGRGGVPL